MYAYKVSEVTPPCHTCDAFRRLHARLLNNRKNYVTAVVQLARACED